MGLSRSFVQAQANTTTWVPINQFPNRATITNVNLSTTPTLICPDRSSTSHRRGILIENGSTPMIFAFAPTVSATQRTALLNANDFYDDECGWQGPVSAATVVGTGTANITEMTII